MTMKTPFRRVLLLSSDDEPVPALEAALDDAGYEIRRCVEPGADAFPCVALQGGGVCPLDDGLIDVALDVRSHPWPKPTLREEGVRCALRSRVPVAVAGRSAFSPFDRWAEVTIDGVLGAVDACDEAIRSSLERHRTAVVEAVEAVLDTHGLTGVAAVEVDRRAGQVHIGITAHVPKELRTVVVTRAGAAVRALDRGARAIEIDLREPDWHALNLACVEPWLDD